MIPAVQNRLERNGSLGAPFDLNGIEAKLPWIPTETQWLELLAVAAEEPIRNRVKLALAYDVALRREKLCSLRTDDVDPAHRTLRVRAEQRRTGSSGWCRTVHGACSLRKVGTPGPVRSSR
ncbi:tyrosine-type recombinase/integrase [Nocardia sp. NPDC004604]|uniref:tyrosine-type recombinase/integrase n=1 Tax=Nocardia sp. NPDC004604 TaxID=3157013 RepID=UPI0033B952D8